MPEIESATAIPTTTEPVEESSGLHLPRLIAGPIEALFSFLGGIAASMSGFLGERGNRATARARPWMEFVDMSAFGLAEGGFKGYIDRLKINCPYFLFNYVILGLVLTIFSVITKPLALVGSVLLVWIYFQFFGTESEQDYEFLGLTLDNTKKIGCMVLLGFIIFWFTAGGFGIFLSVITAVAFVALIHGAFRKPSPEAIPPV